MVVMFWDQQCYCKMLNEWYPILSDIVRYPWYPDDPWKSNRCPVFFLKSLRWFHKLLEAWMISMEHPIETSEMPSWWFGDSQVGRFSRLASFYRSLSRGKNLWCQEARRKSKPSWQTWLSCHMLGTWGYTIWDTLKLQTLRHSTISMCRSDSLMLDQRIYRISMHCTMTIHGGLISIDICCISWLASEVKIIAEINKLEAKPFHWMGQRSHTYQDNTRKTMETKHLRKTATKKHQTIVSDFLFHQLMAKV